MVVDYAQLFSHEARQLRNSALADLVGQFHAVPDVIALHVGLPSAASFPMLSFQATSMQPQQSELVRTTSSIQQTLSFSGPGVPETLTVDVSGCLVHDAQQYMFHAGHPPLLQWAHDMAANYHHPPQPVQCAITAGAVNALSCAIACLCDRGDWVICEEFTYSHAPECVFVPRGLNMLPVAMDEEGMIPDVLRKILSTTPPSPVTGHPPRVMYVVPSGQNPTGAVMPLARKREIYQICQEYGVIILEDDAYFWLQYPQGDSVPEEQQPGLQLPPSFLSMDVDSRVLRIDTFAKLLGPGYRLGWATGHPALIKKLAQAVQAGSCGPSSLSQVVISQLLLAWGPLGFEAFVRRQQAMYAVRAAAAERGASKHLTGLATWQPPRAGMFMWFHLTALDDVDARLLSQLVGHRVVVVPGRPFWSDVAKQQSGAPCPFFRITFSAVPTDQIDEGFARLAGAIRAAAALAAPAPHLALSSPFPPEAVPTPPLDSPHQGLLRSEAPGAGLKATVGCAGAVSCSVSAPQTLAPGAASWCKSASHPKEAPSVRATGTTGVESVSHPACPPDIAELQQQQPPRLIPEFAGMGLGEVVALRHPPGSTPGTTSASSPALKVGAILPCLSASSLQVLASYGITESEA